MAKKTTREILRDTQRASADLQTFGAVVELLQRSTSPRHNAHYKPVQKIIAICNAEMQKALMHMDAAGDELEKRTTQAAKQGDK